MEPNDAVANHVRKVLRIFEGIEDSFGSRMANEICEGIQSEVLNIQAGRDACAMELVQIRQMLSLIRDMKDGICL